jgi:four helix bundle protein
MAREPFERLRCWRYALKLNAEVHRLSSVLPADEKSGLAASLKRASQASAMKIAEAEGRGIAGDPQDALKQLDAARAALRELLAVTLLCKSLRMLRLLHVRRIRHMVAKQRWLIDRESAGWESWIEQDHQNAAQPEVCPPETPEATEAHFDVPQAPRHELPVIRINSPKLTPAPLPG